jgi:hypothetical protein
VIALALDKLHLEVADGVFASKMRKTAENILERDGVLPRSTALPKKKAANVKRATLV